MVGAFPTGEVIASPATVALMRVMLADVVRIGRLRAEVDGDLPPYGQAQVDALLDRLRPLPFGQPHLLLPGWGLTLWPAGHVLGAAMAWLDTPQGVLLVSGDVSVTSQRTVGPANPPRQPAGSTGPGESPMRPLAGTTRDEKDLPLWKVPCGGGGKRSKHRWCCEPVVGV